jgi:hypothetical protein
MKTIGRNLVAVLILAMPAAVQAQFDYVTNADGTSITITGYSTTGFADVIIPATINDLPVTGIGDGAFAEVYAMTSVTIPVSVTNIGGDAFSDCFSLTNVTIPDSVISIGYYAFQACALTEVMIPANVTSIGEGAFSGCTSLTAISVAAQNAYFSSTNGVLFDKNQTTLVEAPGGLVGSYTIPDSVTNIDDSAFFYCTVLSSVTIPRTVSNVGVDVFEYCYGLTTVTIPGSVSNIGIGAFAHSGLTNATMSFGVVNIDTNAFENNDSLMTVMIPGSVTNIAENAFEGCGNLTQVYFTGNAPAADWTVFSNMGYNSEFDYPYTYYVTTAYYLFGTTGWAEFSSNAMIPAVLWNPVIQASGASLGVRNNQFGFNITGTTNIPIVVEACTNLAQPVWVPMQSMTLTNGLVHFSEPTETNSAARFYRISAP